jgi:hypothetical protein
LPFTGGATIAEVGSRATQLDKRGIRRGAA